MFILNIFIITCLLCLFLIIIFLLDITFDKTYEGRIIIYYTNFRKQRICKITNIIIWQK